jgi:hypothetical protein
MTLSFLCNCNTWLAKTGSLIDWTYWLNNCFGRRIILVHCIENIRFCYGKKYKHYKYTVVPYLQTSSMYKFSSLIVSNNWYNQNILDKLSKRGEENIAQSSYTFTKEQNKWCTLEVSFQLGKVRYRQIYWVISVVTDR